MTLRERISALAPEGEQEEADKRLMLWCVARFDDVLTRDNALAHFTASAWIVNPARTHALMAFHRVYGAWAWTGGHADGDDDLLRVALREAREETGVVHIRPATETPLSLEVLHVAPHVRRGRFVSAHLHLNVTYLLEADDSDPLRVKPDENAAVRWMTLEEAVQASTEPYMREIYRKLNARVARLPATRQL